MKAGRFVVDTHVHGQRFAAGQALAKQEFDPKRQWDVLGATMAGLVPYANTTGSTTTWSATASTCASCCLRSR